MFIRLMLLIILAVPMTSGTAAKPQFPAGAPERRLEFPRDFGAHPDFRTEWWYATGWLQTPDGKPLGFQVTFFRSATGYGENNPSRFAPKQLIIAHAGLTDPASGRLRHEQKVARTGFDLAWAKQDNTDVRADNWHLARNRDGEYRVSIEARGFVLQLTLTPTQPVLQHGDGGFFRKSPLMQHGSYYYSEPQLQVTGTVVHNEKPVTVTGNAWLDHEWGNRMLDENTVGWDWIGINLEDGSALMAIRFRAKDGSQLWAQATIRRADGGISRFSGDEVHFLPLRHWRSPRTGASYPVEMKVVTGPLEWQLVPLQDDQEFDARFSTDVIYWEGPVKVIRQGGQAGRGYFEMTGYVKPLKL